MAWDIRLNQIPKDWNQIAVRFRREIASEMAIKLSDFGN
ncbi:hypothetical protein PMIT1320_00873 [Prochlorococcus marinus str. MIT 1320]|nr:hypothetical protein PMIT1320_00873 [Prochlorococcus marinus str. MIT 1320]